MPDDPRRKIRRTRAEWEMLMADYEAEDMTQREFCQERDLAYSSFSYWRRRLNPSGVAKEQSEVLMELPGLSLGGGDAWRLELDLGRGVILRLR